MRIQMALQFLLVFLLTNAIGLLVAQAFLPAEINEQITKSVTLVNDNKQDPVNSIALLAYILGATAVLLIVIRFFQNKLGILFRVVEGIAVFFITISLGEILLSALGAFNEITTYLVLLVAITLVILRNLKPDNIWLRNAVTILLAGYAGALIGTGLGVTPIIIFIILLSVYDFIAVFKTKHMVTLAKAVTKKNLTFSFAIPTPEHTFELGTGDIVMPLAFASSALQQYATHIAWPAYLLTAILILWGSFVGLLFTLEYSNRNIGKALPALPLQTAIMLVFFAVLQFVIPAY